VARRRVLVLIRQVILLLLVRVRVPAVRLLF
jgi:hypothetical protein